MLSTWIAALTGAAQLTVRLILPGWAWCWMLSRDDTPASTPSAWTRRANTLLAGLLFQWILILVLAHAGLYTLRFEIPATAAGVLAGVLLKRKFLPQAKSFPWRFTAELFAATAILLSLPAPGEWLAGGWDPGVYVNEGIMVARRGTFYPEPDPAYLKLSTDEVSFFTEPMEVGFREAFPGVPLDETTRAYRLYFLRLLPATVALLARCGGVASAVRVNLLLGVFGAILLAAAVRRHSRSTGLALWTLAWLVLHPLWLYHTHFPTTEMLQLAIAAALLWIMPDESTPPRTAAAALLLFCAVVSRLDFFAFGAWWVLLSLWNAQGQRSARELMSFWFGGALALAAGMSFNRLVSADTLLKLGVAVWQIAACGVGMLILAACFPFISRRRFWSALSQRVQPVHIAILFTMAVFAGMLVHVPGLPRVSETWSDMRKVLPFMGWTWLGLGLAGALLWPRVHRQYPRAWSLMPLFFLLPAVLTLLSRHIVFIYPWATRRYVAFALPLLALLAASLLDTLTEWMRRRELRPAWLPSALLAALLLIPTLPRMRAAWRSGDYPGLSARLAEVSARLRPGDVVVTDAPRWGTPLALIHGHSVLNGDFFHQRASDPALLAVGLNALAGLRAKGHRVIILTSSRAGMSYFPPELNTVSLLWTSGPFQLNRVIHSQRGNRFAVTEVNLEFQLLEWRPPTE